MKLTNPLLLFAVLLLSCHAVAAGAKTKEELIRQSVSTDLVEAGAAIRELRAMGREGFDAMLATYEPQIQKYAQTGAIDPEWARIAAALDAVAQQKDVYASRLYWHTDLAAAQAAAKSERKPILSLRLLGNLNEEFSCANSRFFRALLYPNAEISKYLREHYVLHWQSVRPAPKVTIDFGDGRKIERTLTGNSIHYVLAPDGRVIDALPGLYGPQKFFDFIKNTRLVSLSVLASGSITAPESREKTLRDHRARVYRSLAQEINLANNQLQLKFDPKKPARRTFEPMPPAIIAASVAMAKSAVEIRVLRDITSDLTRYGDEQVDLAQWQRIAALTGKQAKLDAQSLAFIRRQTAPNKLTEEQFGRLVRNLEDYLAVDSARNEFLLRLSLLVWLNKGDDQSVDRLNDKVYAELFLTPRADEWLGLYRDDVYTALDGNGIK